MSGTTRNRKSKALDAPTKRISAEDWADHSPSTNGYMSSFLWAPFDRYTARMGIVLLGYIMELLGTFLFVLFTNLARQNLPVTNTPGVLLFNAEESLVLGIVAGGMYYLCTGFRLQPDEQPRHLSWSVTLAFFLTFRTGLLPAIIYLCAQTGGAALAGVTLWGLGVNIVPGATTVAIGLAFGFEFLGTFVIVFPLLYNMLLGCPVEEERINMRNGQTMASLGRVLSTSVFVAANAYSFDAVVYLGGLIGFGLLADVNQPYNASPAFFLLVPFAGALAAVIVYYLLLLLFKLSTPTKRRGRVGATEDTTVQGHIDQALPQATQLDDIVTSHRK